MNQDARVAAVSFPREHSHALFEAMLQAKQGLALFDPADRLVYANRQFRLWLGLEEDEFPTWEELIRLGHTRQQGTLIEARDFEIWLAATKARRGKQPHRTIETTLHDGTTIFIVETTTPDGHMFCVISDVSEMGADLRSLRQERDMASRGSWTDELTGLPNRRYIREQASSLANSGDKRQWQLAMFDLDYFKRINDQYGHDVGDVVLKHFASRLQLFVGRHDMLGRLGGEEFVVVSAMSRADFECAFLLPLQHSLREEEAVGGIAGLRYRFSAGVTTWEPAGDFGHALKRADEALYAAKEAGRDNWKCA